MHWRREVDLATGPEKWVHTMSTLSDDLIGVVRETMQPAHASLWLRPETTSKGKQAD